MIDFILRTTEESNISHHTSHRGITFDDLAYLFNTCWLYFKNTTFTVGNLTVSFADIFIGVIVLTLLIVVINIILGGER